jgi:hypothetical protein
MEDWLKGLFGGGSADSANSSIMSALNSGASADTIANMGKSFTDAGAYANNTLGGLFNSDNLKTIGNIASAGKDIGGLYNSLVTMPEYYKNQNALQGQIIDMNRQNYANIETERQRQIAKENEANQAMSSGFASSGLGLYDEKKKQQTLTDTGRNIENSNYYAV